MLRSGNCSKEYVNLVEFNQAVACVCFKGDKNNLVNFCINRKFPFLRDLGDQNGCV